MQKQAFVTKTREWRGMTKKVILLWLQKRPQGYNLHKNHSKLEVTSVQFMMEKGGR